VRFFYRRPETGSSRPQHHLLKWLVRMTETDLPGFLQNPASRMDPSTPLIVHTAFH
jgi:hypothetical protein